MSVAAAKSRLQNDTGSWKLDVQSTDGDWQEICIDDMDEQTAIAVCRDMGYARGVLVTILHSPLWLTDITS